MVGAIWEGRFTGRIKGSGSVNSWLIFFYQFKLYWLITFKLEDFFNFSLKRRGIYCDFNSWQKKVFGTNPQFL